MNRIRSTLAASIAIAIVATVPAIAANISPFTGPADPAAITQKLNEMIRAMNASVGARNMATCGNPADAATASATNQTPVATEVYIAEVTVTNNVAVTGVAVYNGSVASGNLKVGLADATGAVVATSASTASSGTTVYQRVPFTATYNAVGPATYYILAFYDNNTVRPTAHTVGNCGASKQTAQTYATGFTAITPPTTFTTALGPVASLY